MIPLALAFGFSGLSKPFTLFLMAKGHGKAVRNISVVIPIIQLVLKAPGNITKKTLTFAGVRFQNNPTQWDAEADDLLITREIGAKASKVVPSTL